MYSGLWLVVRFLSSTSVQYQTQYREFHGSKELSKLDVLYEKSLDMFMILLMLPTVRASNAKVSAHKEVKHKLLVFARCDMFLVLFSTVCYQKKKLGN